MPDIEFLPAWYTGLLKKRRMVRLQVWLTLAIAAWLGLWVFLADRNQRNAESAVASLKGQILQTDSQIQQMERLEVLRKQWRQQAEVLEKLGLHVESSRLLGRIAEALPAGVSFMGMNVDFEESPVQLTAAARAAMKDPNATIMDRRIRVRLQGVAPTDVDLATFLTELSKTPFFDHIAPTYAKDRREAGHILREFEVTFTVGLTPSMGS
jgi:Tfp pilus assembly protein PilN